MANVLQDPSWVQSSIPLSILTSSNQAKNSCQDLNNFSHSSLESVNGNSSTSSACSSLKERDYIGLSDSSSPPSSIIPAAFEGAKASYNKCDCSDTELRLGIGPSPVVGITGYDAAGEDLESHSCATVEISVEKTLPPSQIIKEKDVQSQLKGVEILRQDIPSTRQQHMQIPFNGSNMDIQFAAPSTAAPNYDTFNSAQKFWQAHMAAKAAELSEAGEAAAYWSTAAAGRFLIPVPKVSTVPAKRPYVDALGDNSAAIYNTNLQVPAGSNWQMSPAETSNKGPFTSSVSLPPLSGVQFKVPAAVQNGETSGSGKAAVSEMNVETENDNGRNKAPVVGWPPVRSFRKNTLAAQPKPNVREDRQKEVSVGPVAAAGAGAAELTPPEQVNNCAGVGAGGSLFVKAKLDGVRICRKVDLKSYESYDSLKSALQEMFQGFVGGGNNGENERLDLLHGNTHVLTHEDIEGDCMLVGDVPWDLFVTTVKSLRIMKSSDAIAGQLGQRARLSRGAEANC